LSQSISLSFLWSRHFLMNRSMLWFLFWTNLLGTVYGYYWYGEQLAETALTRSLWLLPFVPDSPTASLAFTIAVAFLLADRRQDRKPAIVRKLVEAFAVVTSVKYGVWAVSMIWAAGLLGDPVSWQDWMLSISHLAMAAEAVMFSRFFSYGAVELAGIAGWALLNDVMDYQAGVFPWLPGVLLPLLPSIGRFTVGLSLITVWMVWGLRRRRGQITGLK